MQQWWQAASLPGALQVEAFTAPVLRADVSLRQLRQLRQLHLHLA